MHDACEHDARTHAACTCVTGPPAALIADCEHSCLGFERIYT